MSLVGDVVGKVAKAVEYAIPVKGPLLDPAVNLVDLVKKTIASCEARTAMDNLSKDIEKYRVEGKKVFEEWTRKIQFEKKFFFDQRVF